MKIVAKAFGFAGLRHCEEAARVVEKTIYIEARFGSR